jgi:hypothetical protein
MKEEEKAKKEGKDVFVFLSVLSSKYVQSRMVGSIVNNEWERMWKEAGLF